MTALLSRLGQPLLLPLLVSALGRAAGKTAQVGPLWLPEAAPGSVVRGDSFLGRGKGKGGEFLKPPQANFPTCRRRREGWRVKGIRAERGKKAFSRRNKISYKQTHVLMSLCGTY